MVEVSGPIPVFVNASAGRATDAQTIHAHFGDAVAITILEPDAFYDTVAAAASSRVPIVGVAGGDGTMRTAAAALVRTESALLCIPTGTVNTFARRHGIPDIATAAAALRSGRTVTVSIGAFQDSCFLNTLTFGEYARIVRRRERYRRVIGKSAAALIATFATLATLREMTVHLEVEGRVLVRRTPVVWIGVGWGSFPQLHSAHERRSQPDLEVVVVRADTKRAAAATLVRLAGRMLRGQLPLRDPQLEVLHARALTLGRGGSTSENLIPEGAGDRLDATADGEVLRTRGSVHVSVLDAALRVIRSESDSGASDVMQSRTSVTRDGMP